MKPSKPLLDFNYILSLSLIDRMQLINLLALYSQYIVNPGSFNLMITELSKPVNTIKSLQSFDSAMRRGRIFKNFLKQMAAYDNFLDFQEFNGTWLTNIIDTPYKLELITHLLNK